MERIEEIQEKAKGISVLYVEDEDEIRARTHELLSTFFDDVTLCTSGEEGLERYTQNKYDIVMADIAMPIMDGLTMCERIKEINPDVTTIITTAHSDTNYLLRAIEIGVNFYIIKPFNTKKFLGTIFDALLKVRAKQYMEQNLLLVDEIKDKNRKLEYLNSNLLTLVQEETKKRVEKERLLMQQGKMAIMGEMISAIAHQWKQPISVVYSLISIYECSKDGADDDGVVDSMSTDEIMQNIKIQVRHMNQTINDFRDFVKPTKKIMEFAPSKSIEEAMNIFSAQVKKYNIALGLQSDDTIKIMGYPNELKQALLNLFGNAKDAINSYREKSGDKYTVGKITIDCYESFGECYIKVCDNGGGIPQESMDRLFEPYYTTKGDEGTGIGLLMVKNIIESSFGGSVRVYNAKEGACFELKLGKIIQA